MLKHRLAGLQFETHLFSKEQNRRVKIAASEQVGQLIARLKCQVHDSQPSLTAHRRVQQRDLNVNVLIRCQLVVVLDLDRDRLITICNEKLSLTFVQLRGRA